MLISLWAHQLEHSEALVRERQIQKEIQTIRG